MKLPREREADNGCHGGKRSAHRNFGEGCIPRPLVDVQAGEDKSCELKRETSFLGEFLRLAGGTTGFLMGGPAGAAFGSTLGELAGEIAARTNQHDLADSRTCVSLSEASWHEEDSFDRNGNVRRIPSGVGALGCNCRPMSSWTFRSPRTSFRWWARSMPGRGRALPRLHSPIFRRCSRSQIHQGDTASRARDRALIEFPRIGFCSAMTISRRQGGK